MKTKVKALGKFYHGRQMAEEGGEYEFTKGEAEDLQKAGLVEIVGSDEIETPKFADQKMDATPENKMADAPANKRGKKAVD